MWHYEGKRRCIWWGNLMEGDYLKDIGVVGRIILKCIVKKWDWVYGLD
jgi:hypothetical protein